MPFGKTITKPKVKLESEQYFGRSVIRIESAQYQSMILSRRSLMRAEHLYPLERGLVDTETGELFLLGSDT
jgi:hypothetical protein